MFLQALKNGNLEVAYSYMSPDYQQTCSLVNFRSDYGFDSHVDFIEFSDHHYLTVSGDTARLYPQFRWVPLWHGPEYELKKIDGVWYLTGEYIMYVDESAIENYGRYCPFE